MVNMELSKYIKSESVDLNRSAIHFADYNSRKLSRFEYVDPPLSSETREAEKKDLRNSILEDSLTPDLSFEGMKGLGTLSGEA